MTKPTAIRRASLLAWWISLMISTIPVTAQELESFETRSGLRLIYTGEILTVSLADLGGGTVPMAAGVTVRDQQGNILVDFEGSAETTQPLVVRLSADDLLAGAASALIRLDTKVEMSASEHVPLWSAEFDRPLELTARPWYSCGPPGRAVNPIPPVGGETPARSRQNCPGVFNLTN